MKSPIVVMCYHAPHTTFVACALSLVFASNTVAANCRVSFASPVNYQLGPGAFQPWDVAVGDLNGNGVLDLAVANHHGNTPGTVSVMFGNVDANGNPDGTFGPATPFAAGAGPASVAIADFDNDGMPDLAVTSGAGHYVSILRNTTMPLATSPSFASPDAWPSGGISPLSVAVGYFNNDGLPDLAVTNDGSSFNQGNVSVRINMSTGINISFGPIMPYTAGLDPIFVAVGNLNPDVDLWPDLAVGNGGSNDVSIFLNTGSGVFQQATPPFDSAGQPFSIAIGDLDHDPNGLPDLAIATAAHASVLFNQGGGVFGNLNTFVAGNYPYAIAMGDLNGDCIHDLAVSNRLSDNVSILVGTGSGAFDPALNFAVGAFPLSIEMGNFNNDHKPDLVVVNQDNHNVSILLNTSICKFDTNGDGVVNITDLFNVLMVWGPCPQPCPPCAADVDGNCVVDIDDLFAVIDAWGPCP